MYAYTNTPLDEETIKDTSLLLETNSSLSYEAFMASKVFQFFLQNESQISLKLLLNKTLHS